MLNDLVVFLLTETEINTPCWPGWPWKLDSTGSIMNPKPTFTVASSQVRDGPEKQCLCVYFSSLVNGSEAVFL